MCQNACDFSSRVPLLTAQPESAARSLQAPVLASLRLIRVSGNDRALFLQGQLTQDIREINPSRSAIFGWTTAQGRLLVTGQIFDWRDAFWLTVPAAIADALIRRLQMFILRAKVTVDLPDVLLAGFAGVAAADAFSLETGEAYSLPVTGDPERLLIATESTKAETLLRSRAVQPATDAEWLLADIHAGLPRIGPEISEAFTAQMVNLDLIGGINFDKGCYSGQEIITRTRHRGTIKRRMLRYRCALTVPLTPGQSIFGAQRETGRVVSAAPTTEGCELLAVTQLDEIGGPLFADSEHRHALERLTLPYVIPEVADL